MPTALTTLDRPQRWDAAFDPEMTDATVDRLLAVAPFSQMNPENFPKRASLRDILKHDTRIKTFKRGEIIVREGDYGTSAFLVMSGKARVVLGPELPPSVLGRRVSTRKSLFRLMAQLWSNTKEPESISPSQLKQDSRVSERRAGDEVKIFLQDVPRVLNEHRTATLEPGEFFGEIAALSRMPRTASIFAESEQAELLEVRWQGLRDLMKYDEALRRHIDEIYRARALEIALREIPIFKNLSADALKQVMARTEFGTFGDYDWSGDYKRLAQTAASGQRKQEPIIAEEGDYPNGVVLIKAGFGRVSQKFGNGHRTLNYLGAGQIYGLQEIAHNWRNPQATVPLQYTLRVIGYTHVIVIPTAVMETVVLPTVAKEELPPAVTPIEEAEAAPPAAVDASAKIGADMLEFLTENRLFNGTATMMIDMDRCTRCDDCVRACATAHDNNPRFLRHGPVNGRLMVANACMHCVDPVCMIGCPTGAIHRNAFGGQVVINPATCIGCKSCFNNCPYDAIRMVETRDEAGEFLVDKEMKPILKATKCDLCVEQITGPSCQRACPHGALVRINLNDLDAFAQWLRK
ncbi:MAG TPA: cyclic nucleotide-binding domain-containing protein [Verrucomicrobiae bacterium]|jgi:Fe-S-cluster-containing dehydrogenase component